MYLQTYLSQTQLCVHERLLSTSVHAPTFVGCLKVTSDPCNQNIDGVNAYKVLLQGLHIVLLPALPSGNTKPLHGFRAECV